MVESTEGIWMAPSKWGQNHTPAFSQKQGFTAHGEYLWLPPLTQRSWGGRGNKVGAVTHMLHWRVLKFREIKWLSKSHTMMNAPISQILLHLVFCGWELMPWRRCPSLKRAQILLLPLISIFQFLIQNTSFLWAKLLRKTTGFQLCPSSKAYSHTQSSHK